MTTTRMEAFIREQYEKVDITTMSFYKGQQIWDQDQDKFLCQGKVEASHPFKLMSLEQDLVSEAKKRKENWIMKNKVLKNNQLCIQEGLVDLKYQRKDNYLSKRKAHERNYTSCARKHAQVVEVFIYSSKELLTPNAKIANI
jgi:hypothetical protein